MSAARTCKRRITPVTLGVFGLITACAQGQGVPEQHTCAAPSWTKVWELDAGFESPESAAIAAAAGRIFVSNVNGYKKNGAGFISQLTLTGDVLALHWLEGLNAPTGLRVDGDTLWVVDFDRIVKVSISARAIVDAYPAPDENPLLNDLIVAEDGTVFVTGSASRTVYRLQDNVLDIWRRDSERLRDANGIAVDADHVYVAGYDLVAINRADLSLKRVSAPDELVDLEGVLLDETGDWFVSRIGNHPLVSLTRDGVATALFSGDAYIADFDVSGDLIVAPISQDKVAAFSYAGCAQLR